MLIRAGDADTICALSTPPGVGGIAVVRVSGDGSLEICRKICSFLPEAPSSHRVFYGIAKTADLAGPIDEVLVTYFAEGRSFTGEETIEVSCHGGPVMTSSLLKELVLSGARVARPGEFTYRAFMNGRIDLVQAESVLSLIESRSKQSARVALRQLQGHLSSDFGGIEDDLVWILAHLEAGIDFSTEGIELVSQPALLERIDSVLDVVSRLIGSYSQGRLLREGLEIALAGRPNAGKSSLLNAFLGEERAIVTPHAGTTRDTIEGQITIGGFPVTFVDTAGLRETENEIEVIGIDRTFKAMKRADLVFMVLDTTAIEDDSMGALLDGADQRTYFLLNKVDLDESETGLRKLVLELEKRSLPRDRIFPVSARTRSGLRELETRISTLSKTVGAESSNVVTQARHVELLEKIQSCVVAARGLVSDGASPEFIAFELQESVRAIHELLGKEFNEQVIDRIFKEFCLGK